MIVLSTLVEATCEVSDLSKQEIIVHRVDENNSNWKAFVKNAAGVVKIVEV